MFIYIYTDTHSKSFLDIEEPFTKFSCKLNSCILGDCSSITDWCQEYDSHIHTLWAFKFAFFFALCGM